MSDEPTISTRLVEEISGIIRARQASLAILVAAYGHATWEHEDGKRPEHPITHEQIRDLVSLVIETFEGVAGEIQGAIEIDATLFTRGIDFLRDAENGEGASA